MVDPQGEVYVVSKVGLNQHPKLVHLPASAWGAHHRVQVNDGIIMQKTSTFVGGDISPDGHEVRSARRREYTIVAIWNNIL